METIEHWIDGRRVPATGPRRSPVHDPARGTVEAEVGLASPGDVDRAVAAARRAHPDWAATSLGARSRVLFAFRELLAAHADELAHLVSREHGKVLSDARGEVQRGLEVVEFCCGIPTLLSGQFSGQVSTGVDAYTFRQPLGVMAGITPFNFPFMVPMWMHPVAIACGNTFVLKPSERDPSVSLLVGELWARAGLPAGVFNVLQGDRDTVEAILDHPDVAAVSFVGSTPVARQVHERATAAGKRVQALGGAKNHAVVLSDADLDLASDHLASAAFGSAGERCMAISVVVAVGSAGDALVERLAERARGVRVGPSGDPTSDMGPLITADARDRVVGLVDSAERQGATIRVDGRTVTVPGCEDGFWVGPTVIDHVSTTMDVYAEEVFGPVLAVLRTDTLAEAVDLVNANPYGNGTAVFTEGGAAARQFVRNVEVGMVGVNVPVPVPMAHQSFGGWKDSLFGDLHVHGPEGIAFCTRGKVVTQRWAGTGAGGLSLDFPTSV